MVGYKYAGIGNHWLGDFFEDTSAVQTYSFFLIVHFYGGSLKFHKSTLSYLSLCCTVKRKKLLIILSLKNYWWLPLKESVKVWQWHIYYIVKVKLPMTICTIFLTLVRTMLSRYWSLNNKKMEFDVFLINWNESRSLLFVQRYFLHVYWEKY